MGLYKSQVTKCGQELGRGLVSFPYSFHAALLRVCSFRNALGHTAASSPRLRSGGKESCCPPVVFRGNYNSDCTPAHAETSLKTSRNQHLRQGKEGDRVAWEQEATKGNKMPHLTVNVAASVLSLVKTGELWITCIVSFQ